MHQSERHGERGHTPSRGALCQYLAGEGSARLRRVQLLTCCCDMLRWAENGLAASRWASCEKKAGVNWHDRRVSYDSAEGYSRIIVLGLKLSGAVARRGEKFHHHWDMSAHASSRDSGNDPLRRSQRE